AAGAAVARVAAGASGGIIGERAVDDREAAVEAADRSPVAGGIAGEAAAGDDRVAAAETVHRAARNVLPGRGTVVVVEYRIKPGQAAAVAIDGAASLRGVDTDGGALAVAKREPLHHQPWRREIVR